MTERTKNYEEWLTALIDERFSAYAVHPSPSTLDELYVLVGTLKIVGFDALYESNRKRLLQAREQNAEVSSSARPKAETTRAPEPLPSDEVAAFLRSRIIGQDAAVTRVVERLSIARAGLKLRPERPNAVLLFAGPTGVGKTELARALAVAEYGDADALIRLDMSEYANEASASKLIGPDPGYAGYNDPEGWLTSRVRNRPRSIVLFDEIEKAHPSVWNVFLQMFDAGRLTDGRGAVADFSRTVIIMTSNLGVREAARTVPGFGSSTPADAATRQRAAIAQAMPTELLNRIDEVIVFDRLGLDDLVKIAGAELVAFTQRLGANDWMIEVDASVPQWLAHNGYDPVFGARHLQRTLERDVLVRLAASTSRQVRLHVSDGTLHVVPA